MKKLFLTLLLVSAALAKGSHKETLKESITNDIIKKTGISSQYANIFAQRLIDKEWNEQGGPVTSSESGETTLERFKKHNLKKYKAIISFAREYPIVKINNNENTNYNTIKGAANEGNINKFKALVDRKVQHNSTLAEM